MKKCRTCGKEKELSSFYRHKMMADGRLNICIDCIRSNVKKYRIKNIKKVREYDNIRSKTAKRLMKYHEYSKKWRSINRLGGLAHVKVERAKISGKIKSLPCEVCGSTEHIHAHHDDYTKPLSVRWLCAAHHAQLHAARRMQQEVLPLQEAVETPIGEQMELGVME